MVPVLMPLLAFGLPALVIMRNEKRPVRRPWLFSLGSFAAALAALCQELWVFCRRADNGDVSGILDTAGAVLVNRYQPGMPGPEPDSPGPQLRKGLTIV